jgi:hypothetical protein
MRMPRGRNSTVSAIQLSVLWLLAFNAKRAKAAPRDTGFAPVMRAVGYAALRVHSAHTKRSVPLGECQEKRPALPSCGTVKCADGIGKSGWAIREHPNSCTRNSLLRKTWFNFDLLWGAALVATGLFTLLV